MPLWSIGLLVGISNYCASVQIKCLENENELLEKNENNLKESMEVLLQSREAFIKHYEAGSFLFCLPTYFGPPFICMLSFSIKITELASVYLYSSQSHICANLVPVNPLTFFLFTIMNHHPRNYGFWNQEHDTTDLLLPFFFVMFGFLAQLCLLALLGKVGQGRKAYLARWGELNCLSVKSIYIFTDLPQFKPSNRIKHCSLTLLSC